MAIESKVQGEGDRDRGLGRGGGMVEEERKVEGVTDRLESTRDFNISANKTQHILAFDSNGKEVF